MFNIVLHQPEIPFNTGNIGRTCVATGAALHLIKPYGFILDDKHIKRSGLDYWPRLKVFEYDNFDHFMEQNPQAVVYMATTKAPKNYADVAFNPNDFIMFGKESAGIPEEILLAHKNNAIRIPMVEGERSLNIGISVAVVLYEALRQQNFTGMQGAGQLHHYQW